MASFKLKLAGLTGGPWGLVHQIPDNAMNRILKAARAAYGPIVTDPNTRPPTTRDMTDQETAIKMFQSFTQGWLDQAFVNERALARSTADTSVVKDTITSETTDNT